MSKKHWVMVRVTDKIHARLAAELELLRDHRDFGPLASRFKHAFSFNDLLEYLLEKQANHRKRAREQAERKRGRRRVEQ